MTFPKEANIISQYSGYSTAPEAMVKFGQTSPPYRYTALSIFAEDARNQDVPEAMPKIEGMTSMDEPLWIILQNKVAKIEDHECTTMQDNYTIMQQAVCKKDMDCDMLASQLREYEASNLLLPPLAEPLQRPSTPVRIIEMMDEAPETLFACFQSCVQDQL
jgi:hypothetical protein